jgi:hypothetical protein
MFGVVLCLIPKYIEDTLFHGVWEYENSKSYTTGGVTCSTKTKLYSAYGTESLETADL